jgi:putative ABC transport system permease protein
MKFLPLIRAGLRRRPLNAALTIVSVAIAFLLAGLALGFAAILPGTGSAGLPAGGVAALGFVMILALSAAATAHTVRTRRNEFAVLKALGFPLRLILGLLCAETAILCLAGAMAGLGLAEALSGTLLRAMHPGAHLARAFVPPALYGASVIAALILSAWATALPALRIAQISAAAALRGDAA